MLESAIKAALKLHLAERSPGAELRFIEEFKLERGQGRADLVEVSQFHCYEIKSDSDSLSRLIGQGSRYAKTFRKVTLVTAERHLARALPLLPVWWGVMIVPADSCSQFRQFRPARQNRAQEAYSLASTLVREECIAMLESLGHLRGWKTKSLYDMQAFLARQVQLSELATIVPRHIARRCEADLACV